MTAELTELGAEQLARVVEISRNLNSSSDINELLTYIIKEAASLTGTEAASILLLDPHTNTLNFMAASNDLSPEMAMTPVPLDSSIAGAVVKENRPLHIADVTADPPASLSEFSGHRPTVHRGIVASGPEPSFCVAVESGDAGPLPAPG